MHRWRRAAWARQEAWESGEISTAEWLGTANFALTTSNFFARTGYLRQHPLRAYRYAHDYFALAYAAITGRLGVLPEELLQYRVHAQNTIKTEPARLTKELQKVHLDLVRALAEPLTQNQEYRRELAHYLRAAFQNISSFRMDVFLSLCAGLAAGYSEEEIVAGLSSLTPENFPELDHHPNTGLIDELISGPISAREASLAQELKELKTKLSGKNEQFAPAKHLAKLRQQIIESRWMNLGRILGAGKHWARDQGSTPEEKLQNLKNALRESPWYKMAKPFEMPED
jgi:hypothetical protein